MLSSRTEMVQLIIPVLLWFNPRHCLSLFWPYDRRMDWLAGKETKMQDQRNSNTRSDRHYLESLSSRIMSCTLSDLPILMVRNVDIYIID